MPWILRQISRGEIVHVFEDREPGHEPRWQRWLPRSIGIKPLNQQSSQATAWFSRWKASFERIRQRFGMPVAVLLALLVAGGLVGGRRRRFGEVILCTLPFLRFSGHWIKRLGALPVRG